MTGDVPASTAPAAAAAEARMIDVRSTLTTHRPSLTHVSGRRMPALPVANSFQIRSTD